MIIRILSVNGFVGRSAFAVYRGANVYYMSDTKGFDADQVAKTSAQSFGFVETAGYHLGESVVDAGAALKDDFSINSIDLMIENLSKHKA